MKANPKLAASVRESAGEALPDEVLDQDMAEDLEGIGA
jgi:hypothetical protein